MPFLLLIFFIKSKPFQNKILQVFSTHAQFNEIIPNFAHFEDAPKMGMKQGLEGQARVQR